MNDRRQAAIAHALAQFSRRHGDYALRMDVDSYVEIAADVAESMFEARLAELRDPLPLANVLVADAPAATKARARAHGMATFSNSAGPVFQSGAGLEMIAMAAAVAAEVCEQMMRSPTAIATALLHIPAEHRDAIRVVLDALATRGL